MPYTITITPDLLNQATLKERVQQLALTLPCGEAMTQDEIAKALGLTTISGQLRNVLRNSACAIYLMIGGHKTLCLCHPETTKQYAHPHRPAGT
jgi:alkylated DNA nucleotide flippase Atl1